MSSKIIKYLNQNKSLCFRDLLFSFIDDTNQKDANIYNRVNIDRRLFSKIRCNVNYIPKKYNIIKLCISLELDLNNTNKLLSSAGYALSNNDNIDLIIMFCIENNIYDINIINDYLFTYAKTTLL